MVTLGCGVGLRSEHFEAFAGGEANVDWVEIISENFMAQKGRAQHVLDAVRRDRPVTLHGVALCVGGSEPLDGDYIAQLKALVDRVEPAYVSDHLCWGSMDGSYAHDLLPLPMNAQTLKHVVARVCEVQDRLGRTLMLENISSYIRYRTSDIPEWEFLAAVAQASGCGILLDVNNIYVNAHNHGFDAHAYLRALPRGSVQQMHVAGHTDCGTHLLDTHKGPVPDAVWDLYRAAVRRFGDVSTLIEWDEDVPALPVLLAEATRAADIIASILREDACGKDSAA